MASRRSQMNSTRTLHIIDAQTRARYANQREANKLRRKLIDINAKHTDTLARLTFKRYDIKTNLHEIQHEIRRRGLRDKLDYRDGKNSTSSNSDTESFDENQMSTSNGECFLLYNLSASNQWEKSFILPSKSSNFSERLPPMTSYSKCEHSFNSFEQTHSFLLSDSLTLRQVTDKLKRSIQITLAKSTRDARMQARREILNY